MESGVVGYSLARAWLTQGASKNSRLADLIPG